MGEALRGLRGFGRCRLLAATSLCALGVACGVDEPLPPEAGSAIEERIDVLLAQMTLEEKVEQMHGSSLVAKDELWETPDNERLGIPGFRMVDGPRGVRAGKATTFPVGMARGATWDPELERRVGEAMGLETAAKGGNVLLAPTINVLRHPSWGRAQETYGEDPHHIGKMGVASIEGIQRHVIASAKHFAVNSIEDTRFEVSVELGERSLREVYLPHFKQAVQVAKTGSVMSAYNRVNGEYAAENDHLLRDILKGEWGFDGFVESDWILGTRSTVGSALAGLDIEMPFASYYGQSLVDAVRGGEVPEQNIDDSVRRILRKKLEFGLFDPASVSTDVVESPEHVELAREVAEKGAVLLKNEASALPLEPALRLVVVGELADTVNLGDAGSSNARPSRAVTPLEGLRERVAGLSYLPGPTLSASETAEVAAADAAVVVVGLTATDEGERIQPTIGGDRLDLGLSNAHRQLVQAVAAANDRTIVVLEGGSAITMDGWLGDVRAVLMAWYPGMQGGHAIARLLLGEVAPSGKLPITFPESLAQLPTFDNVSDQVEYGYFHGYRFVDKDGHQPLFPFGFGLSYTSFRYDDLRLGADTLGEGDTLQVAVDITNTGARFGEEIVELYVGFEGSAVERPERVLAGFERVALDAGQSASVELEVPVSQLAYWDEARGEWVLEPLEYRVEAGSSSRDLPLSAAFRVR